MKNIKEINANNIILLGNKKDLSEIREVEEDDINIFIKDNGNLKYLEISSKNNEDIDEAFDKMIQILIKDKTQNISENKESLNLNPETEKKRKCCK